MLHERFRHSSAVAFAIALTVISVAQIAAGVNAAGATAARPVAVRAAAAPVRRTAAMRKFAAVLHSDAAVPASAADIVAIDAGGPAVAPYAADEDETTSASWTYATSANVSTSNDPNPPPQAVYQSQRTGSTTYTIGGLTPGVSYGVRLHFAELFWNAAGKRVFNVTLNGSTVVSNLDVFAAAGGENIGVVANLTAVATAAGHVSIGFVPVVDWPIVNAIEIQSSSATPAPTPTPTPTSIPGGTDVLAINAGGPADAPYVADEGETTAGTWTYATTASVSTANVPNPPPEAVYQSQRTGATTYTIGGLTPGVTYGVRLHFAELFWNAAGKRVFNVTLNGTTAVSNLDVFTAAGGENIGVAENLRALATSAGRISIGFVPVVNSPIVNAIEIQTSGGPTPTPTPTLTPPPATQDNVTYHNNNLRTGWYANETTLTAANVASGAFHRIGMLPTAGKSYSQPLYLSAQQVANGSVHDLLIVTDSTDVVYAYDADSLALVWSRDFKGGGVRQQLASDIGCDDTWPNIGINGTPVVDRSRNRMYVVVPTNDNGTPYLRLHAISLTNGADAVAPAVIAGSEPLQSGGTASIDPAYNFNRAGLLETSGTIYVPLSTHCDFDSNAAHGWVLAYNPDSLAPLATQTTTDSYVGDVAGDFFLGSVWQGGFGIAADAQSNIFFATGNGPSYASIGDDAMSVNEVPPTLNFAQRSFFTPSTWQSDSQNDLDLGSGGVMLLPDQTTGPYVHLAIAGGKTGVKFLLNRDNLGGLNSTDRSLWEAKTDYGMWGGPAYFVDANGNQKIVYGGTPNLDAFTLTTSPYGLSPTSSTNVGQLESRNGGVTPIVSSNGTQAGSAIVWAISTVSNGSGPETIKLYAFNGANLSNTLFSAVAGQWTVNYDTGGTLITPLVANGRVYLATDGEVTVWGIH